MLRRHKLADIDAVLGDRIELAAMPREATDVRQAVGNVFDTEASAPRIQEIEILPAREQNGGADNPADRW